VKYVVDGNVLSEGTKLKPVLAVRDWLVAHRGLISINPIILGEIEFVIQSLPAGRNKERMRQWLTSSIRALPVLDIDTDTAIIWAVLLAEQQSQGRTMPVKDSLIAATAIQHGLTIATRNVDHFRYAGVPVVNPFEQ